MESFYLRIWTPDVAFHLASMTCVHVVKHDWFFRSFKEDDKEKSEWEHSLKQPLYQTNKGLIVLACHQEWVSWSPLTPPRYS